MNNQCNCSNCDLNFNNNLKNLRIYDLKHDLETACMKCKTTQCPTYELSQYLNKFFPNFNFTILDLTTIPQKYRKGICNYIEQRYPIED